MSLCFLLSPLPRNHRPSSSSITPIWIAHWELRKCRHWGKHFHRFHLVVYFLIPLSFWVCVLHYLCGFLRGQKTHLWVLEVFTCWSFLLFISYCVLLIWALNCRKNMGCSKFFSIILSLPSQKGNPTLLIAENIESFEGYSIFWRIFFTEYVL